jgi:putative PIN family toxin of toxin-antitoxin system
VIDTQIFLRAATNLKSPPAKIVFDLRANYQLVTSEATLLEVRDVLSRPKIRAKFPHLTDSIVERVMDVLSAADVVKPTEVESASRDPKDDIFLACAKADEAQYIVSEDKDLLVLSPYEGIQSSTQYSFSKSFKSHHPKNNRIRKTGVHKNYKVYLISLLL